MKAVLTFSFIRTRILSILAQLAHEELFKIMILSSKLSITTTLTNYNKFPTFFNPVGMELYTTPN